MANQLEVGQLVTFDIDNDPRNGAIPHFNDITHTWCISVWNIDPPSIEYYTIGDGDQAIICDINNQTNMISLITIGGFKLRSSIYLIEPWIHIE